MSPAEQMQRRNMLSKLILIKACTYDLAEIDFSKGDAMQLVGGNNVGKSSLICALNFLFVLDRRRMTFTGGRSADKATMAYYFPEAEGASWSSRSASGDERTASSSGGMETGSHSMPAWRRPTPVNASSIPPPRGSCCRSS